MPYSSAPKRRRQATTMRQSANAWRSTTTTIKRVGRALQARLTFFFGIKIADFSMTARITVKYIHKRVTTSVKTHENDCDMQHQVEMK